jgi:hypothetical protein
MNVRSHELQTSKFAEVEIDTRLPCACVRKTFDGGCSNKHELLAMIVRKRSHYENGIPNGH